MNAPRRRRSRARRLALLVLPTTGVLVFVLGSGGSVSRAQNTVPSLRFLDSKVTVQLASGEKSGTQNVTIANDAPTEVTVSLRVIVDDTAIKVTPKRMTLGPSSVTSLTLTFTPQDTESDLDGRLVAESGNAAAPAIADLEILLPRNLTTPGIVVVVAALIIAAVVVINRGLTLEWGDEPLRKFDLMARMGPVNWKFSDSWASNLTAVGAILGTVVAADLLPERPVYVGNDWFTALNVFFGALLVVAPFVYSSLRVPKKPYPGGDKEPEYRGVVIGFLIACGITLWGVLGELLTLGLFMLDVKTKLGLRTAAIPVAVGVGVLVCAILYAWNTIRWTLEAQIVPTSRDQRRTALRGRATALEMGFDAEHLETLSEEHKTALDEELLPRWSLL